MKPQEIVFLFDIDGTLLHSGGAGQRAMQRIMGEMFGLTELAQLDVHGRTDRAIIEDLFRAHGLKPSEAVRQEFIDRYHEQLVIEMPASRGRMLPGVRELLDHLRSIDEVHLGLLTGNSHQGASAKLAYFQIDHYFAFGGYGSDATDRSDVAMSAAQSAAKHLGLEREQLVIWVVGDTVHDIRCARAIGAYSIAVETGGFDRLTLSQERPDVLLTDLTARFELLHAVSTFSDTPG